MEPVAGLRTVVHAKGVPCNDLVDGDATNLDCADGAFDVVCAFGVLHHIKQLELAVREMLRVARQAIFISHTNNFGQGSAAVPDLQASLRACGLCAPLIGSELAARATWRVRKTAFFIPTRCSAIWA